MIRYTLLALLLVPCLVLSVRADDTPQRVEKLITQLGSNDFQERAAAQTELEKIGLDAVAALEKAVKSDDKEVSRRAEATLSHIRAKLEDKAREKLFGKASKFGVDVFVAYLANQPTDVADDWKLLEKLTTDLTKGAGKEKTKKLAELELLPAAKMGNGFDMVGQRAVGGDINCKRVVQGALVANGSLSLTEGLVNSVVFANGAVTIDGSVVDCVIVCDGDVTIKADAIDAVILASGKVSINTTIDTVIVAGGAVTTEKKAIAGSVKEKNALPLGTFKFSALVELGVEVAAKDGKVRVEKVGTSPLAKALQKDDILLSVDKVEIGSVDALRRALRKGLIAGQAGLKVQRGDKVLDVPVQLVD